MLSTANIRFIEPVVWAIQRSLILRALFAHLLKVISLWPYAISELCLYSSMVMSLTFHELDFPQIDIDQLVQQSQSIFPFDASLAVVPSYAHLDTTPDTSMELSAIPYMFCTPRPLAVPASFYSSASWIEEELAKVLTDNRFEVSSVSALDLLLMDSELLG